MTCIVGIRTDSGVLLGGDLQGTSGLDSIDRVDGKVFNLSPQVAFGFTSSYRMGQILRFHVECPLHAEDSDEYRWAVTKFIPAVRVAFTEHGYKRKENEVESGGTFLLAIRARLFKIHSDFQVGERADGFDACGSGEDYALGAFHATATAKDPRKRAEISLAAAARFNVGVGQTSSYVETSQ